MKKNREKAESFDVAIIGAGIAGCSAAYFLSKAGKKVVMFDKGRVAGEQSTRNWGAVRQQRRDLAELPLMIESIRIWESLEAEIGPVDWRQQGLMRIAYDEKTLKWGEDWLPTAREYGLDTQMLTPGEVGNLLPHFDTRSCLGALFTSNDGCAEPQKVAPAFADAAKRLGAEVRPNCAVREIVTEGGTLRGVDTENGEVRADTVLVTSGAWTSRVLKPLGIRHPSLWIRGTAAHTQPIGIDLRKLVAWGRSAYRQRPDGSLTLAAAEDGYHDVVLDSLRYGASFLKLAYANRDLVRFAIGRPFVDDLLGAFSTFTKHRTLEPAPDQKGLARAVKAFAGEYPGAPKLKIMRSWAGWIDYMPDELPVLGPIPARNGLFVAAGFHGNGFGMGPVVGKILSDLVVKGRTDHDLSHFSAQRFAR